MRLITGIDTAMPDVKRKWNYHANWNQNDRLWREDFRQLADAGFDLLRWQAPWSLVEPKQGEYHWELIDPQVDLATKLGLEDLLSRRALQPPHVAGRTRMRSMRSSPLNCPIASPSTRTSC